MTVSVIAEETAFFCEIEKAYRNFLPTPPCFSKRSEMEKGFTELKKIIVGNRITWNSESDTTNETSD